MNSIDELQDLCNYAISISINDLMIYWIEFSKTLTNNKSILETYDKMIDNLKSNFVDEFDDPYSIAEVTWGKGAGEGFRPIPDIHDIYYQSVRSQIDDYFVNKFYDLSTDKGFQTKVKNIQNNLETFFTIPTYVIYDQVSRKSTFHTFYGKYSTWFNKRSKTQEVMNANFESLKKLVDEYY